MRDMANDEVESEEEERRYLSCCASEGVEYRLYDNVKVYDERYSEPHIGKIAKLWEERASGTRKVLIRWFLKHKEVKPHAHDNPRELFLAFGQGKGVANENDLDVIVGKCKVVCTSKDPQIKQPSANVIENSDFFFSHVYDVDLEHTCPVERVVDKLGFNASYNKEEWATALIKIERKADKLQTNQESKDEKQEFVGSAMPEARKRPRDVELVFNSQKKNLGKQSDLKKGHLSFDGDSKKKKIKVSEYKASVSKENLEKAGADSVSNMKEMQSKDQCLKNEATAMGGLNSGDVLLSKRQITDVEKLSGGAGLSSGKAEMEEKNSSESSIPVKVSSIKECLPFVNSTMDIPEQHAVAEPLKNKNISRQVDDKVDLDEKAQSKASTVPKNKQMLENMDVERHAEDDLGFLEGELDSRQFTKTNEVSRPDNFPKAEAERRQQASREAGISGREKADSRKSNSKPMLESSKRDSTKEGGSNITKKMKTAKGVEAEKRPMSTVEMVKAIEKRKIFKELDMLKSIFQGLSDARVLPQETICPSGQALAIFETKLLADCALEAMEMKCLVVTDNKRPVIASRVKESSSQFRFPGHLALEKLKLGRNLLNEDYKRAVSTSHCSQPNTIEFEMAMEWRQLQEITQNCRVELFKRQRKEFYELRSRGNSKAQRSKQEGE
eukprot:c16460_g1_i1 orf=127-2133(+)